MLFRLLIASAFATGSLSFAAGSVTLTGKVTDNLNKPLPDATVMIYQAGVKQGYSTYCPSCYVDCGKRTVTDSAGAFTIKGLSPDLRFELLVVRDGYSPTFVPKADPSRGPAATAVLAPRPAVTDDARVVRGRVVDTHGEPLRGAVIEPEGVSTLGPRGEMSQYGTIDGLEPVAVSNANGEFELSHSVKATGMMLRVEARGMATKLIAAPTGPDRTTITVSEGATIRGRLVDHGKPASGAEIGLIARNRGGYGWKLKIIGDPYAEIRIGTQEDGTFVIPNVPAPVAWYVYGKMESIAARGATDPVECATAHDGETVNVGDIEIHPGHRLSGTVTLSDGAAIADGMRVTVSSGRVWDSQTVLIGPGGRFEASGLPAGKYQVFASVRGYRMPGEAFTVDATVDKDVDNFALVLDRASRQ